MTRDEHIAAGVKALARTAERMAAMERQTRADDCCPGCLFGQRWTECEDKAKRQSLWLAQLLVKRGGPGDAEHAERVTRAWG